MGQYEGAFIERSAADPVGKEIGTYTTKTGKCPTPCDGDCDATCHEMHQVNWKRDHQPEECPSHG